MSFLLQSMCTSNMSQKLHGGNHCMMYGLLLKWIQYFGVLLTVSKALCIFHSEKILKTTEGSKVRRASETSFARMAH